MKESTIQTNVSEWSKKNRGTPYLQEIFDSLNNSDEQKEITIIKGTCVGFTIAIPKIIGREVE